MFTLFVFLAVLGILVISHEFGHFIMARRAGIRVEEFGFGFPPRLFGVRRLVENGRVRWQWVVGRESTQQEDRTLPTLYSFNLIPLGGFVRIKGENSAEIGASDADSFARKSTWIKTKVLLAGVAMNVLVAYILLSVGFMIGQPTVADGTTPLADRHLHIVEVLPGTPAEQAGLLPGDVVLKMGEANAPTLSEFQTYVAGHEGMPVVVTITRGAETIEKTITPTLLKETGRAAIGVALADVGVEKYVWYKAFYKGIFATGAYIREILVAFGLLFKGIFTGQGVDGNISGPVGVAVMTGEVARLGISYLLQFTAMLSLNLAVLNALPIPALDGGRWLFVLIGAIRRHPVTPRLEQTIHAVGFMALMFLVVVVTAKDLGTFKDVFIGWFQAIL
jgi:regulator of sigma E protease